MTNNIDDLLQEIKLLGNPAKALEAKLYHKSERQHWGVTMPQCATFAKSIAKDLEEEELLALAEALWMTDLFDPMMCASKLICLPRLKPSPSLWMTINRFLKKVDGWALEDSLAPAAGKCLLANKQLLDELEAWTTHSNFWMRRAALVYTLPFAKPGRDPERMLGWASSYVEDPEWFIQKAIGWWLRDLGKNNPERVLLFLKAHWHQLKSVARKEATRKLSPELQIKTQSI